MVKVATAGDVEANALITNTPATSHLKYFIDEFPSFPGDAAVAYSSQIDIIVKRSGVPPPQARHQ